MTSVRTVAIDGQADVELARHEARSVATGLGFDRVRTEMVVLAVSELATNLLRYARGGTIVLSSVGDAGQVGVQVESRDRGPGIVDIALAMQDNFSTGGGIGSGLPSVRRLMDEFVIESSPEGTTVTALKWKSEPGR